MQLLCYNVYNKYINFRASYSHFYMIFIENLGVIFLRPTLNIFLLYKTVFWGNFLRGGLFVSDEFDVKGAEPIAHEDAPKKKKRKPPKDWHRHAVELDKELFEKMCASHCTKKMMCGKFGVTDKTIDAWVRRTYNNRSYADVCNSIQARGDSDMMMAQYDKALSGNVKMMQWWGLNYLGQSNKPVSVENDDKNEYNDAFSQSLGELTEKMEADRVANLDVPLGFFDEFDDAEDDFVEEGDEDAE